MMLTPLEALLLSVFASAITGLVVKLRSVTPKECNATQGKLLAAINKLDRSVDITFRMLRSVVAHMDLPADTKAEILNTTAGKE